MSIQFDEKCDEVMKAAKVLSNFNGDMRLPITCALNAVSLIIMRYGTSCDGLSDRLRTLAEIVDDLPIRPKVTH